jgi:hypothetical protein
VQLLHPAVCEASRFPYLVQVLIHPLNHSCHHGIEIHVVVLNHTPLPYLRKILSINNHYRNPSSTSVPPDPPAPVPLLRHTVKHQYNPCHKLHESTQLVIALGTSEHHSLHQMPTRNLRLQESDKSLLIPPKALVTPATSILDTSFAPDMAIEEWTDWMQWDVGAVATGPAPQERQHSFESTHSIYDTSETSPLSTYSNKFDFSFEDAPFDFEEVTESSQLSTNSLMLRDLRRPAQGYTTLTAAEQQSLQAIAMPHRTIPPAKRSSEPTSPTTSFSTQSRSPSPIPKLPTRKTKKRKSSMDDDGEEPNALCQSRKRGHNAIEKRYRTNLNDKISCLRQGIPPLWRRSSTDSKSGDDGEDSDQDTLNKKMCQPKYGKAAILTRALEYIQHLEGTTQRLGDEVAGLRTRVGAFERLAMSGSVILSNAPASPRILAPKETLLTVQAGRSFHDFVL